MDKLNPSQRSRNMQQIRSKHTRPELKVRSIIHRLGYRFRVHRNDLPGRPDIVLPRLRKVVQVHGCFWHQHAKCGDGRIPKTRQEYWVPKLNRTVARDDEHLRQIRTLGWKALVVWECELEKPISLIRRLEGFLAG